MAAPKGNQYAKGNKGGRPTDYSPEVIEKTKDYLVNYQNHGDVIPSIAGLAVILGVRRETLHAWARDEDKEEFSHILGQLLAEQEKKLLNNGLGGTFSAPITKLVLGKHGYHDKQEVTGKDGGPVKNELSLDRDFARRMAFLLSEAAEDTEK